MIKKTFYIVTTHNKEFLIGRVLKGIEDSNSDSTLPVIICVLDGCTDGTEKIVLDFKEKSKYKDLFHTIYLNDVHEIISLNTALNFLKTNLNPKEDEIIVTLQDDVILKENFIDLKLQNIFKQIPNLGYLSLNIGVSLNISNDEIRESEFIQSEFGHWNQLGESFHYSLNHENFLEHEIAIRSPAIFRWGALEKVGFFDENLAPAGYDCHDMSIRMRLNNFINGVYALKFESNIDWGSMRGEKAAHIDKKMNDNYVKNRKYIAEKHSEYFKNKKMVVMK